MLQPPAKRWTRSLPNSRAGYGDFKTAVAEAVIEELRPIQQRFDEYMKDKAQLEALMKQGAERASAVAGRTLFKAKKKMGFVQV